MSKDEKKKKKKSAEDEVEARMWLIFGGEETPIGIAVAKTKGGAKRIYEERTGHSRDGIYVEALRFKKQFVAFIPLV